MQLNRVRFCLVTLDCTQFISVKSCLVLLDCVIFNCVQLDCVYYQSLFNFLGMVEYDNNFVGRNCKIAEFWPYARQYLELCVIQTQ